MEKNESLLSNFVAYSKYARYKEDIKRRESWDEAISRLMTMHFDKFKKVYETNKYFADLFDKTENLIKNKEVLPSMRSIQFGGKAIEKNENRLYNCAFDALTNTKAFADLMYNLLSGTGEGYSVQKHHIEQLPDLTEPNAITKYDIEDSIEGWAKSIKVLMDAYMGERVLPNFNYKKIRKKGEILKTAGGRAPGPEPLREAHKKIMKILSSALGNNQKKLKPIQAHDIACHIADAVLSGGIRRSAMIALFSKEDEEMLNCKSGTWWIDTPFRARANNSIVLYRPKLTKEEFIKYLTITKDSKSGEPGIFFTNDLEAGTNPCGEIGLRIKEYCNLTTQNDNVVDSEEKFYELCEVNAFIGTLQAAYNEFDYLHEDWSKNCKEEALLGCSRTGIASMNVTDEMKRKGVDIIRETNKKVAKLIGINPAARLTTVKPEGTTSSLLCTSSGIHPYYSPRYVRRVIVNKEEPIHKFLMDNVPNLMEESAYKPELEAVLSIPMKAPEGAYTRNDTTALKELERIKEEYNSWIIPGTNIEYNKTDFVNTHNVSSTVYVKDEEWDGVINWMWNNKHKYAAISLFPYSDSVYQQQPFEDITEEEYQRMYDLIPDNLDFTKIIEEIDSTEHVETNVACAGGNCEI